MTEFKGRINKLSFGHIVLAFLILLVPLSYGWALYFHLSNINTKQLYIGVLLLVATVLWANKKKISTLATCIFVLAALEFGEPTGANLAFSGFAGKAIWMFFSFNILALGISEVGLHRRLALYLIRMAGGDIRITILVSLLIIDLSLLVIPSGMGRVVLFFPLYIGIAGELGLNENSNFIRGILLGAAILSTIGNPAVMISGAVSILAAELFSQIIHHQWTYLHWIQAFLPAVMVYTFALWLILLKVFPPEKITPELVRSKIEKHIQALGPLSNKEKKVLIITLGVLGFIIVGHKIGLQPLLIALVALFLLLTPPYEISWRKSLQSFDWLIFIFVGTILSLVVVVREVGLSEQLGKNFFEISLTLGIDGRIKALVIMMLIFFLRIPFSAGVLYNGISLPLVFELAPLLGINSVWAGMLVHQIGNGLVFLPSQSPQVMFAFQKAGVETSKVIYVGLIGFVVFLSISLLLALYYWPLLGYSISM